MRGHSCYKAVFIAEMVAYKREDYCLVNTFIPVSYKESKYLAAKDYIM
jgi:hypothetical protein